MYRVRETPCDHQCMSNRHADSSGVGANEGGGTRAPTSSSSGNTKCTCESTPTIGPHVLRERRPTHAGARERREVTGPPRVVFGVCGVGATRATHLTRERQCASPVPCWQAVLRSRAHCARAYLRDREGESRRRRGGPPERRCFDSLVGPPWALVVP